MRDGSENPWALVLAAGDGMRLRSMTTTADGLIVPKQFCSFGGSRTLLGETIDRAWDLVPTERIVAVVAEPHRAWWTAELQGLAPWNVVVQPRNRGTAAGVLLPLLAIAEHDPDAVVIVLPSDHHVEDRAPLNAALRQAVRATHREPEAVVLLGIVPDEPDCDYGWILPGLRGESGLPRVADFVEKPDRTTAAHLLARGGLWSSFVMVGRVGAFLQLIERELPDLVRAFRARRPGQPARIGFGSSSWLNELYDELPVMDFSRTVLQNAADSLRVIPVAECGWSDLGTPERVVRWLNRRGLLLPAHVVAPVARMAWPRSVHVGGA